MSKKLSYQEFISRAKKAHKNKYNYSLITEEFWRENYKHNQKTKIPILCKEHGIFYQTVFDHLQGHGCLSCAGKQKWSIEKIKNDLKKLNLKFIKIIKNENLKNKTNSLPNQYMEYFCEKHGIQKGKVRNVCKNGCKLCSLEKRKKQSRQNDLDFWQKRVKNFKLLIAKEEFKKIYTNSQKTKVKAQCIKCGKIHLRSLFHLWQKGTCSCQKNKKLLNLEAFLEKAKKAHKNKYDYSLITEEFWRENYIGKYKTKIPIICKKHGVFYQTVNDHVLGSGCPKCNQSKGEKSLRQFLEKNKIKYITEYQVPDSKLRFDFYLPDYNLAIEYDGELHYKNTNLSSLKKTKQRDFLKNRLCFVYRINLIRIPYHFKKNLDNYLNYIFKRENIFKG